MILPRTVISGCLLMLALGTCWAGTYKNCGGVLKEDYGSFQSPNFPELYPPNSNCIWTITVPEDYLVALRFPTMDIEENPRCRYDYVAVYDGATLDPATKIGQYCSEFAWQRYWHWHWRNPGVIVSTGNVITVNFISDGSKLATGFNASFGAIEYKQELTGYNGTVQTPTHPDTYPHNANFSWTITLAEGYYVELEFIFFHLEGAWGWRHYYGRCPWDHVTVYNGPSPDPAMQLGRYCGTRKPPVIQSWTNSMFIQFISDGSVTRYGFKAVYTAKTSGCVEEALISGTRYQVEDSQLSASSSWGGTDHSPRRSLLNTVEDDEGEGAWSAARNWGSQWIQVEFGEAANVTGIATQGRNSSTGNNNQWVKSYTVQYSLDGQQWATYSDPPGIEKIFYGNSDRNTTVEHNFTKPIYARFVRLRPRQWNEHISLRWQLYGCFVSGCVEGPLLSLTGNQTLTASSYWGDFDHRPHRSRVTTTEIRRKAAGSWCAAKLDRNQWIQVAFKKAQNISSVLTRGRNARWSFQWVKSYTLQYGQDGQSWTTYRENGADKVFPGNKDRDTPVMHHLTSPFIAKFVRLQPRTWRRHISLRWELFTCTEYNISETPAVFIPQQPSTTLSTTTTRKPAVVTPASGAIKKEPAKTNSLAVALSLVIIGLIALFAALAYFARKRRVRKRAIEGSPPISLTNPVYEEASN